VSFLTDGSRETQYEFTAFSQGMQFIALHANFWGKVAANRIPADVVFFSIFFSK
jgi:hypothetical protein